MAEKIDARSNTITQRDYLRASTELIAAERDIAKATSELAAARGVKSGILKRAVGLGADKAVMLQLSKFAKLDEDERAGFFKTMSVYAEWTGVKLWQAGTEEVPQGALFTDEALAEEREKLEDARAFDDGYFAGQAADDIGNNPWQAGTSGHAQWVSGWHQGQASNAPSEAEGVQRASGRRGRRGNGATVN